MLGNRLMLSADGLQNILKNEELKTSGNIVHQDFNSNRYLAFVLVNRDHRNLQVPSNGKLAAVKSVAAESGYDVEFILIDEDLTDVEAGARATMLHAFSELIRNVFLTVNKGNSDVWIDQKRELNSVEMEAIQKKLTVYLSGVGLKLSSISMVRNENVPSNTVCLKAIRLSSPVDASVLTGVLTKKGFDVPSLTWMNHKLDHLRKNELVIRLKNGKYVLSLNTLKVLGTSKLRSSPDITRMLDIARRGG
jgi:hypothetical protein